MEAAHLSMCDKPKIVGIFRGGLTLVSANRFGYRERTMRIFKSVVYSKMIRRYINHRIMGDAYLEDTELIRSLLPFVSFGPLTNRNTQKRVRAIRQISRPSFGPVTSHTSSKEAHSGKTAGC